MYWVIILCHVVLCCVTMFNFFCLFSIDVLCDGVLFSWWRIVIETGTFCSRVLFSEAVLSFCCSLQFFFNYVLFFWHLRYFVSKKYCFVWWYVIWFVRTFLLNSAIMYVLSFCLYYFVLLCKIFFLLVHIFIWDAFYVMEWLIIIFRWTIRFVWWCN